MDKTNKNSGQVMLLTVLVLSAVFLTAAVIAGVLLVYQLSQVTAIADSQKAVFAADAAIERALFKVFRCNDKLLPRTGNWNIKVFCDAYSLTRPISKGGIQIPKFLNDATYLLSIEPNFNAKSAQVKLIKATGNAGKSARAFEIGF